MIKIKLTQGKFALIDDEDYALISKYKWCAVCKINTTYAKTHLFKSNNSAIHEYMHRMIMMLHRGDKQQVDHIDGNGLNNQKLNLRVVTRSQNGMNKNKKRKTSSKYKGVYYNKLNKNWRSRIHVNREYIELGSFDTEIDAAKAYDAAAKYHFGIFSRTNL